MEYRTAVEIWLESIESVPGIPKSLLNAAWAQITEHGDILGSLLHALEQHGAPPLSSQSYVKRIVHIQPRLFFRLSKTERQQLLRYRYVTDYDKQIEELKAGDTVQVVVDDFGKTPSGESKDHVLGELKKAFRKAGYTIGIVEIGKVTTITVRSRIIRPLMSRAEAMRLTGRR